MRPVRFDLDGLGRACRQLLEFAGERSATGERRRARMAAAGGSISPAPEPPAVPPAYLACLLDLADLEAALQAGASFELTADEVAGLMMLAREREQFFSERQPCPKCGRLVPAGWRLCRHCGELLGDAAVKAAAMGHRAQSAGRGARAHA